MLFEQSSAIRNIMDKVEFFKKRADFFEEILRHVRRPPERIDSFLRQDGYYRPINEDESFYDEKTGDLAICVTGKFFEKDFKLYYSFWQIGDILRIGVTVYDEDLQMAFKSDAHNEIYDIWGLQNVPRVEASHEYLYYDWEFEVPNLYDNYVNQEKYVLGARHMHFRVLRIISDECYRMHVRNSGGEHPGLEEFENVLRQHETE